MKILALDTTMQACSVAYLETDPNGQIIKQGNIFEPLERGHAERLIPMIAELMEETNTPYQDLDRIAVTLGPGTFTGVRIGVATARGLALSLKCNIVGISSLEVMAYHVIQEKNQTQDHLVVAIDARRDQLYVQTFNSSGKAITDPQVLNPAEVSDQLPKEKTVFVGSGAKILYEAVISQSANSDGLYEYKDVNLLPNALDLAKLVKDLPESTQNISPLYLRPADAKPQLGKTIERININ